MNGRTVRIDHGGQFIEYRTVHVARDVQFVVIVEGKCPSGERLTKSDSCFQDRVIGLFLLDSVTSCSMQRQCATWIEVQEAIVRSPVGDGVNP